MLQVYTGTGKGKTTAALGVAFRGAGYDLKTTMFSFLKDDPNYGEARAASLLPGFVLKQVGRDEFVNFYDPDNRLANGSRRLGTGEEGYCCSRGRYLHLR